VIARAEPPAGGGNGAPTPEEQRASNGMGNLFLRENAGENLDSRIASGEFSASGSVKEQMTRPLRKALARDRDPGIGESAPLAGWCGPLGRARAVATNGRAHTRGTPTTDARAARARPSRRRRSSRRRRARAPSLSFLPHAASL